VAVLDGAVEPNSAQRMSGLVPRTQRSWAAKAALAAWWNGTLLIDGTRQRCEQAGDVDAARGTSRATGHGAFTALAGLAASLDGLTGEVRYEPTDG
jgi:hypothetical protein